MSSGVVIPDSLSLIGLMRLERLDIVAREAMRTIYPEHYRDSWDSLQSFSQNLTSATY
jgi:hypothetical protein